jgi:hypothetical protein
MSERVGELGLLRGRSMWLELHAARLLCMAADPWAGALAERDVTWLVMVMGWDGVCAALDEGVATAAQLRL